MTTSSPDLILSVDLPASDGLGARRLVPRGARLDEAAFAARHLLLWRLTLAHLPVLAGLGLQRGEGGWLLWGQLAAVVVLAVVGRAASSQAVRGSAVALGLIQAFLQFRRMQNEEAVLCSAFPEYATYAARVPMIIPRLAI